MSQYYFEGIAPDKTHLKALLQGEDEASLRDQLSSAKIAVLSLTPYDPQRHASIDGRLFEYLVKEGEHQTTKGVIFAQDQEKAMTEIHDRYQVVPTFLHPLDIPEAEKATLRAQSVPLVENAPSPSPAAGRSSQKTTNEEQTILQEALSSQSEEQAFLSSQISLYTKQLEELLQEHNLFLNAEEKRQTQQRINHLHQIKHSNNLAHLRKMLKELFVTFEEGTIFLDASQVDPSLITAYESSQSKIEAFIAEFKSKIDAGLLKIQQAFSQVDQQAVKEALHPRRWWSYLRSLAFFCALTFSGISLISWAFFAAGGAAGIETLQTWATALHVSLLFWYCLGLSLFATVFFGIDLEIKWPHAWQRQVVKSSLFGVFWALYSINAPTIFFWTL